MTKMNRRDSLRGIGAAALTIANAGKFDLLGQGSQKAGCPMPTARSSIGSAETAEKPEAPLPWEPRWLEPFPTFAHSPAVTLAFYGLNGFSRKAGSTSCDVGFHSKGDSKHHHRLSIAAYSNCTEVFSTDPDGITGAHRNVERIELGVEKDDVSNEDPRLQTGVFFFEPKDTNTVRCRKDLQDPRDFRWIVDFESDYLYRKFLTSGDKFLPQNTGIYRPAFPVPYGLFYTLHRTPGTFRVQTANGDLVSDLGNVADLIGADIYLKPNANLILKVNGQSYPVQAPGEIYFYNLCYKDDKFTGPCVTKPHNLQKKNERNDFFLNYKAIKRGKAPEYELFVAENLTAVEANSQLRCLPKVSEKFGRAMMHQSETGHDVKLKFISDESPCAGSGYGGGGGIPHFPPG